MWLYFAHMGMNSDQCRMARAALKWSTEDLSKAAAVGINTVQRFERGSDTRQSSIVAMERALADAGAVFVAADAPSLGGGPGVRLRA